MRRAEKNLDVALIVLFFLAALAIILSAFWVLSPNFSSADYELKLLDDFSVSYLPDSVESIGAGMRLYRSDSSDYSYVVSLPLRWNGILRVFFAYSASLRLVSVFVPHNSFAAPYVVSPSAVAAAVNGERQDDVFSVLFLLRLRYENERVIAILTDRGGVQ